MSNTKVVICVNCKSFWYVNTKVCTECYGTTLSPTADLNVERIRWVETDPDRYQLGRQIGEQTYEFKEYLGDPEKVELDIAFTDLSMWFQYEVDLNKFSDAEKEKTAETYYGSLDELKEQCGDSWEWILAECIFELESNLY